MNPRGRWRRRRNLRRVPTTELDRRCFGPKTTRFPYRIRCMSPFLSVFFLKSEPCVHRPARKVVRQKKEQTDRQTEKSGQLSSSAGTRFWSAKCQIPVAKPLKSSPQNEQPISLKEVLHRGANKPCDLQGKIGWFWSRVDIEALLF